VTRATCRFPTAGGLCQRPVAESGMRCYQHEGRDAVAAAAEVAADLRDRGRGAAGAGKARGGTGSAAPTVAMSDAQIAAVVECLNRHGVRYVVVGGAASQLHGAPVERTRDTDIVPAKNPANLDRLAAALREMDALLWVGPGEPEGVEMTFDRRSLGQIEGFLNLITRHGPLDITYRPDGTDGYPDLSRGVVVVSLLDVGVPVAALRDVIRSKEAAGRAKDLATLPALIEHLRRRPD
jgi:hypothetical protein